MRKTECPLCSKSLADLLKHLSIVHDVTNADQFAKLVAEVDAEGETKQAFRAYVTELYRQVTEGKITAEEYRRRMTNWSRGRS